MIEAAKDYLAPKRFHIVSYVCVIVHFLCGSAFTVLTAVLRASENGKFSCFVDGQSAATYKKQVEQACFLSYDQTYNSPLPFYGFVLLSTGSTVLISVIYSLVVWKRVDEIESYHERRTDGEAEDQTQNRRTIYVFYSYFVHLVLRALFGIIFTVLQHTYFYSNGFHSKFSCNLSDQVTSSDINTPRNVSLYGTLLTCKNATASEKSSWGIIVSVLNTIIAFIIIVEIIYLFQRSSIPDCHSQVGWNNDSKFVTVYFLGMQYNVPECQPLTRMENPPDVSNQQCGTVTRIQDSSTQPCGVLDSIPQEDSAMDNSIQESNNRECSTQEFDASDSIPQTGSTDNSIQGTSNQEYTTQHYGASDSKPEEDGIMDSQKCSTQDYNPPHSNSQSCSTMENNIQNSVHFYKQEVKNRSRAHDINYIEKISVDDMYIDVIIHTERARHKFSRNMERHEIYDVYMKVPSDSIRLEKINDLFYPNEDTKGNSPRSILAIGRPGIGKTVLTEKLLSDWVNEIDEFYRDKIVFFFKLRLLHHSKSKNISLKTFLQLGTRLDTEKIESIYQKIVNEPEKAIFIFDGLDEFNAAPMECLDQANMNANDRSECMSGMSLFIKLVRGEMLRGATVLVTTRPTAYEFYWKLDFDRKVEIIGFTSDKIKEYVSRFCNNKNRCDLKQTIWNHIKSSSELLNLCYIPVNCLIMCATLYECLNDLENDTNVLPKTLTELYEIALYYVGKKHQRNADAQETLKKLQLVAFNGMKDGKLVFEHELFDEQMKSSGLLNHLSDSISPEQFCFTHLTLQEFLAARHVTETLAFAEIKTFISDHMKLPKWHLVLQFISGLLGKKTNKFPEESKDWISAFVEGLEIIPDQNNSDHKCIRLGYNEVFVMKCLREVNDVGIVKDVCETTVLDDIVELRDDYDVDLLPSEWAAVTTVCEHMSNLAILELTHIKEDSLLYVQQLLQKRCIKKLQLSAIFGKDIDHVFSALRKVNCTLKDRHTCTKLTSLELKFFRATDEDLSNMRTFFVDGDGSHLEKLNLGNNKFSEISKPFEMLKSECFPKLAKLILSDNAICDEDAEILWDALTKGLHKLTTLDVSSCRLTNQCIPSLCKALQDERCQLTVLSLENNEEIGDDGACMLFEKALGQEHCKLTELCLDRCLLTDYCVPALVEALQDERCQLTVLSLDNNKIGDAGACMLFKKALGQEHCKLTELCLDFCLLTDHCFPALVEALQDERCQLTVLSLWGNMIGDAGACMLFEKALGQEYCKLTELDLSKCALTDHCVPAMVKALQDERCQLTVLSLNDNKIGDAGACMLFEKALGQEHCKLAELCLDSCLLTDHCVPALVEALRDERCQLTDLSLNDNKIGDAGACMLFEKALGQEHCKLAELCLDSCLFTDDCVPALVEALQDERCRLTNLDISSRNFTEDGKRSLRNVESYQTCKDRGLRIWLLCY